MGRTAIQEHIDVRNVTKAEYDDLRQKFQLLEGDRKAYYEMSMQMMKENKEQIARLREENKGYRKQLASLQRQTRNAAKRGSVDCNDEVRDLDKHVSMLRKNHDTLKATVESRRKDLRMLRDKALELELESQRPNAEDSPQTRKIRLLENRLDKAMIKYNEAQSIRKTYEQIVKRLKSERVGFDNQLAAIERTLQAKQHDYEELLLLSGDANHAKDVAVQELERVKKALCESRKHREREHRNKKELVNVTSDITNRMEKREQMRVDMIAKAQGDLSAEEELNLKTSLAVNTLSQNKIAEEAKKERLRIDVYEDAFRKIKEATGVADVNEVIQKIISQEDTQTNLGELTRENQDKIDRAQVECQRLRQRVEEIKYSGNGGGHRRKMVDDHEDNLTQETVKLERTRLKYERLAKSLINVKAGISHLYDKLEAVQQDNRNIVMTDDTVVEVLMQCENTLSTINGKLKADDAENAFGKELEDMNGPLSTELQDSEVFSSRPYNQRIALPDGDANKNTMMIEEVDLDDAPIDEDGEEELTRERIKKASHSLLQSHERRGKKKKTRNSVAQPNPISTTPTSGYQYT